MAVAGIQLLLPLLVPWSANALMAKGLGPVQALPPPTSRTAEPHTPEHVSFFGDASQPRRLTDQAWVTADGNLCSDGKLLPELYLLGAQKCATSSFAQDMISLGMSHAGTDTKGPKEFHFFDEYKRRPNATDGNELEVEREAWLRRLPDCPTGERRVIGDYTPSNLRTVPLPQGTTPTGSHWGMWFLKHSWKATGQELNLPMILSKFYGTASSKISLVVMLRSPLERMQSAWYHARIAEYGEKWRQCRDCAADSFEDALSATIDRATVNGSSKHFDDWLWASLYGRQIEAWLEYFNPRQLYVVPFKYYVLNYEEKVRICTDICADLEYSADCGSLPVDAPQNNTHRHPPVLMDAPVGLLTRFSNMIKEDNLRLARVLAAASREGAMLAGYEGPAPTAEAVWRWLEAGW